MKLTKIKELAAEVFKTDNDLDKVFATEDGQIFLPMNKSAAENHANRIGASKREKPLKVLTIKRADVLSDDTNQDNETTEYTNESIIEALDRNDYYQLSDIVRGLKLYEGEGNISKADAIALLEEYIKE